MFATWSSDSSLTRPHCRAEVGLIVSEKGPTGWTRIRDAQGGARPRQVASTGMRIPATVQRKIEQGARYQELLARLLELSAQLQGTLTREQRALWLRLEDVLFEYAQVMAEAHYAAGRSTRRTAQQIEGPGDRESFTWDPSTEELPVSEREGRPFRKG